MRKRILISALVVAAAAVVFILSPSGAALSQDVQTVIISNWPKTWNVNGSVSVDGPISHSRFVPMREVTVSPVSPKDTMRMVQGGTVPADGFTAMVLGISGQIKGEVYRSGTVGVFLIPDEDNVIRAFEEKGIMQFTTEVNAAGVSAASPYFASSQVRAQIGFPRYRTYFYNTSDKTVTVNLYAYLTN